jgi:hypothetical protein
MADFNLDVELTNHKKNLFPLLPKMWTRFDEGRLQDAGEVGDSGVYDLR